ncbi:hypothetical protein BGY98DRAFT_998319 [Russula aff. rugulosa BPL654]|nr:hypothetical protein BGY98DRAFT_998319 [Russula aff. rugulosa BPL654]
MSFLNKRLSKANGMTGKSSKRKSQLADLPLVEAQLVPSLRDTPPIIYPHTPSHHDLHDPLPSSSQHQPYPSTPPAQISYVLESSRIPTPVAAAKAKPNLKPALKNTVASNTSWCSAGQGSPTKASPSRSLRSVKGIIGRKIPQIPAEPTPSDINGAQSRNVTASMIGSGRVARERSHTDPGHASRIPTPRVPPPVYTFSTPGHESQHVPLNRGYDSSGSELHLQTDRGRALFVTNAVSEDVETSQPPPDVRVNPPAWPSHIPQRNHPYGRRSTQSGIDYGSAHSHAMANNEPDADIESEYNSDPSDENANPLGMSSSTSSADLRSLVLNRQISRPGPDRNSSATSRDGLPNPWDYNDLRPSEVEQRRRELIELVNEMDNGFSGPGQTYEYDDLSDDEYTGEQGLAISPSDEFDHNMHTTLKAGDEIGTHHRRRSPVAGQATPRPRSEAHISIAFSGDRTEYSSPRSWASKKNQGTELRHYAQYVPDRAISPSQRPHTSPLTRSSFKNTREAISSSRAPTVSVAPLNPTRHPNRTSGSARSSEKTLRMSREPSTTSSFKSVSDGAHSSSGIRALNRAHGRKGTQYSPRVRDNTLPHADSSSSIESLRWQHEDQSISVDAEAIFEQLGTRRQSVANENSSALPQRQGKGWTSRQPETPNSYPQPTTDLSDSHDLPPRAYEPQRPRRGERNSQAQQIIWDLCETERAFVRRLQTFVRLFICPLRMKDSVTWLTGVPPEVARLFDWLEDIINLHTQISSALRAIVSEQYPIVMRVAGRVRSFVSRLEVHQPYVRLSGESNSDFGEFIRIQQEQDECQGWSVEAFLVEPVNRLVDYPIHFKRLLDVTPQGHPDHLATFSLLHCTETIIRVMREVKLQEEEYELVKDRMEHIKGLPTSVQLAHRSRRLLARGRLERENPRGKTRAATTGGELHEHGRSHHLAGVRQSRLISVIQSRAVRSDSIRTTSESNASIGSRFSDDLQSKPYPSGYLRHSRSASSLARQDVWERQFTSPRNAPSIPETRAETLILSARHDREMPGDLWNLIEGIVIEDSSQIVLDLLPVDLENIATGRIPDSGQVITLSLSVPPVSSSGAQLDMAGLSRLRHNWVSAFQECAEYTLRALSFPTESGKLAAPTPGLAWETGNNPQTSLPAIVTGGLPLPKSPSTQVAEQGADPAEQEREARGWWGLRFQQVLREMQRDHGFTGALVTVPLSSSTPAPGGGMDTAAIGKRRSTSQPRVLKLSSLSSSESVSNHLP